MKTKEEIDELYHKIWDDFINKYDDNLHYYSFVEGYNQCQEDMQKDVEYWQGEFEHWYKQAMDMSNKYNELLNKKDNE
jgi:general stress protein 26